MLTPNPSMVWNVCAPLIASAVPDSAAHRDSHRRGRDRVPARVAADRPSACASHWRRSPTTEYGALVSSGPAFTPSTWNCTADDRGRRGGAHRERARHRRAVRRRAHGDRVGRLSRREVDAGHVRAADRDAAARRREREAALGGRDQVCPVGQPGEVEGACGIGRRARRRRASEVHCRHAPSPAGANGAGEGVGRSRDDQRDRRKAA